MLTINQMTTRWYYIDKRILICDYPPYLKPVVISRNGPVPEEYVEERANRCGFKVLKRRGDIYLLEEEHGEDGQKRRGSSNKSGVSRVGKGEKQTL